MVGEVLICGAMLAGSLLTVTAIAPWIALLFIPIIPAYEWVRRRFVVTAREVKRLDSLAASPIFSNFGETLQVCPIHPCMNCAPSNYDRPLSQVHGNKVMI